jgi:ABC-type amino acid transport substrate-binding protein
MSQDQFPRMLYQAGGSEHIHGAFFTTLVVHTEDEQAAALDAGWHLTTPEAVEAQAAARAKAAQDQADAAAAAAAAAKLAEQAQDAKPPTREELEAKATELGIAFKPQTSDKKLAEFIAAKLAEQGA